MPSTDKLVTVNHEREGEREGEKENAREAEITRERERERDEGGRGRERGRPNAPTSPRGPWRRNTENARPGAHASGGGRATPLRGSVGVDPPMGPPGATSPRGERRRDSPERCSSEFCSPESCSPERCSFECALPSGCGVVCGVGGEGTFGVAGFEGSFDVAGLNSGISLRCKKLRTEAAGAPRLLAMSGVSSPARS